MGAVNLSMGILLLAMVCTFLSIDNRRLRKSRDQYHQKYGHWKLMAHDHEKRIAVLLDENAALLKQKQSLTQAPQKEQNPIRRVSGAQLRRISEMANAAVPEPTQAERLENHG